MLPISRLSDKSSGREIATQLITADPRELAQKVALKNNRLRPQKTLIYIKENLDRISSSNNNVCILELLLSKNRQCKKTHIR